MNQPPPNKPRQRLQALLAIPEGQRTEAQWDELNELEIMMAVSNRPGAPIPGNKPGGQQQPRQGGQPNHPGTPGGGRKFHNRPRRGRPPPGR